MLRIEHKAAMRATHDLEECYRFYRMVQELNDCIERTEQELAKTA
jgi:hypothetical protein